MFQPGLFQSQAWHWTTPMGGQVTRSRAPGPGAALDQAETVKRSNQAGQFSRGRGGTGRLLKQRPGNTPIPAAHAWHRTSARGGL